MSATTIQRELAKPGSGRNVPKLTVRQHLEKQIFSKPPDVQTDNLNDLQEMIASTFSNDAVADEMAQRIGGLATARIADLSTMGQDVPVDGLLTPWFMRKAFRLILKGCSRVAVARQLGVDSNTHRGWLKIGQKMLEKYSKDSDLEVTEHQLNCMTYYEGMLTAEGINSNELTIMIHEAAKDDWRAAAHLLARRHPDEWGSGREKVSIEVSGEVEVKHTGILAVAPVAQSIEEWRAGHEHIIDVDVEKLPDLTAELQRQEADG
jgi:hypothetical protein